MKRRVQERELEYAISQHKRWLLTGEEIPGTDRVLGEGGECADFTDADLRGISIGNQVSLAHVAFRSADLRGASVVYANLNGANFQGADLGGANLQGSSLYGANLQLAKIQGANFYKADLRRANLQGIMLEGADLSGSNLQGQDFKGAKLHGARLRNTNLREADLRGAILPNADLSGADLSNADLTGACLFGATLVSTTVDLATFTACQVYGISVWDVIGEPRDQSNLIITPGAESAITVDNLDLAQFIYLLLNNEKVRHIIDAVTSKVVLILGRFSDEQLIVLNGVREALRRRDLAPILFDFKKPASKDVTGTVETLARMAKFIIADLTDPSSIPHELATIVPFLRTTPVLPIRRFGSGGYTMFEDLKRSYSWVLDVQEYTDGVSLIAALPKMIAPADDMANELRTK
jgi:uncharacterized protein YjbI with pentapeptide repeats